MAHKCDGCRYKGQHTEMMFRPLGVCTKELNLAEAIKAYNAEKCPHKSNGDNVRGMNDEQLAEWALFRAIEIGKEYNHSLLGLIKWLKQPAE